MEKLTYNIKEAAALLGISKNNAYTLAHNGELPVIRFGKRLLVPKAMLDKMLDSVNK